MNWVFGCLNQYVQSAPGDGGTGATLKTCKGMQCYWHGRQNLAILTGMLLLLLTL